MYAAGGFGKYWIWVFCSGGEKLLAIKTEEYIKYLTEKVIAYMDMPPEVRKEQRSLQRSARDPWHVRWFGMIPLSLALLWKRRQERKRKKEHPNPE